MVSFGKLRTGWLTTDGPKGRVSRLEHRVDFRVGDRSAAKSEVPFCLISEPPGETDRRRAHAQLTTAPRGHRPRAGRDDLAARTQACLRRSQVQALWKEIQFKPASATL